MKTLFISFLCLLLSLGAFAQWKPAGERAKTRWAEQINPDNVLPEYLRPIMERGEWKNLNGLMTYDRKELSRTKSGYVKSICVFVMH